MRRPACPPIHSLVQTIISQWMLAGRPVQEDCSLPNPSVAVSGVYVIQGQHWGPFLGSFEAGLVLSPFNGLNIASFEECPIWT